MEECVIRYNLFYTQSFKRHQNTHLMAFLFLCQLYTSVLRITGSHTQPQNDRYRSPKE
jgi:hypothetical protein